MNYTATLLVLALLSQLVVCSISEYRAVCITEYSSVLKRFYDSATHFHHCLQERPSGSQFMKCLSNKEKAKEHYRAVLNASLESNTALIDFVHGRVCEDLNIKAELLELPKDIAFDEYDVLNDSANINEIFRTLRIGIKIKTRNKNVLKRMNDITKLLTRHSKVIKQCLYTRNSHGDVDFHNCLSIIEEGKLLEYLHDFPDFVMSNFGGYDEIDINDMDEIDLIIELNKFLNFIYRKLIKNGEIVYSAHDRINEQVEYDTGKQQDQFDWIIKATGMFGIVIIIALLVYCIRGKRENDEALNNEV